MKKLQIAVGAVVLVGVGTALLLERHAQSELREQNRGLQQQVEELARIAAESPPGGAQTDVNSSLPKEQFVELLRRRGQLGVLLHEKAELGTLQADNRRLHSNLVEQLLSGKKLSLQQVAPYLEAKQRSAQSLLAASRVTGDQALLREALQKSPSDPRVNFAAHFALMDGASLEERRQRLDALKQASPDDALANYLSAQLEFKAGQTEEALQELAAASGKSKWQDYSGESIPNVEEVYRAAGLTELEAKTLAVCGSPSPQLVELRQLGESLGDLANRYRQGGDETSAQAALQMGAALGRRVGESSGPSSLIQDLVGIAIERKSLGAMDPASPYDSAGQTVQDRLAELGRQRESIKEVAGDSMCWQTLSEQDQFSFLDRLRTSGELEAIRWARSRRAKP